MKKIAYYVFILGISFSLQAVHDRGAVLVFTIKDGKAYFLLGKEKYHPQPWDDFGGGLNKGESPENGAHREGSEESKLIFGKLEQQKNNLINLKDNEIFSLLKSSTNFIKKYQWGILQTGTYRIIIKIDYIDPQIFTKAQTAGKHELNEKSDYKWFPITELIKILPVKTADKKTIKHLTYMENNNNYLISRFFAQDLFELRNQGFIDQILLLEQQKTDPLLNEFVLLNQKLQELDKTLQNP